ncbi:MAG: hypothetical protein ACE5RP_07280 [Nitrosopumilus sp.]
MENTSRDNESSISKDNEFKIQISTEDINRIDEEIRGINNSSNHIEKSNEEKNKPVIINIEKNQNMVNGLRLLNVCTNCKNEFIPKNSMINEKLCKSCLEN